MSSQIKLTYFDSPGRAELTRLAFVMAGIAFEDERVKHEDFAPVKPTLPLGQVPVLTVDGVVYPQSMAMARYVGRLGGLYPTDPMEALKVDVVLETLLEAVTAYAEIHFRTTDEEIKKEKTEHAFEFVFPKIFRLVESSVHGDFVLGTMASLADLYIFVMVKKIMEVRFPEFDMSPYPKMKAIAEAIKTTPRIATYLASLA
ncbi:hypothetical protein Poli38472_002386 [Pythium oligandrum]|uniref:Glutathione S-transferase n=1 Tax=Pythium oligandrum TaxID=41045 RepID=A0A8K1CHR0_PYTOL|nr:hypothetical protein Poli38472_002386 [Pythium oligandrum]|eukprot:TMW63445.1 hypothetical protein Poli38472_002386 [Pythium oligandrum]